MNILPEGQPGIGQIIGEGLADIANQWAGHRSTTKALMGLGFSSAEAKAYSHLGPQFQQQAVQAKQQQKADEAYNAKIKQSYGAGSPGMESSRSVSSYQQPEYQSTQPQGMQGRQLPHEQQQAAIQQATSIAQNPAFRKLNEQQQQAQALQAQQSQTGQANPQTQRPLSGEQQAILQSQAQQSNQKPSYEDKIEKINQQRRMLDEYNLKPNDYFKIQALLNSDEDRALKEEQHRQKQEDKKEERIEKREDKLRVELDSISKRAERAQQDIHLLKQIKAANDTGTLVQGPKRKLLENLGKKYGFDFPDYFTNTTTQYTAKAIERMQTGAGTAFGTGRLTNFIAEAYGKSLPRLANTQEGMDLIVKNLMLEDKGHIALNDEIRKIKAEYREANRPLPFDIQDQARERVQPTLDKYADESLKNIETAVAKQQGLASGKVKRFDKPQSANKFPEGAIMTDNKTGKKQIVKNGEWQTYGG